MDPSSGQAPEQKRVDCSESETTALSLLSCTIYILKYPVDLGGREVGVDEQSGLASDQLGMSGLPELVAELRCPAVLPDNGTVNRYAGLSIPYDGCLSLVGYADCRDILRGQPGSFERLQTGGKRGLLDFLRVMLHLA